MSWIQKLCETYDYAVSTRAVTDENNPLPEVGFVRENVAIEVTLSADGAFLDADLVPKERQQTVIPCTLESGMARQHPVRPHPIFDKAKLLATPEQLEILKAWCDRPDTPPSVKNVYSYLARQTLKDDLTKRFLAKRCSWDENFYVRFSVIDGTLDYSELWMREDVKNSWERFFRENWLANMPEQLCYATGNVLPAARKHPNILGNTMLISMVDDNCTGHFGGEAQQAVSVSCEATIKAHNTWKWLAARQGIYLFGMNLAVWDTRGFSLPDGIRRDSEDDEDEDGDRETGPKEADTDYVLGKSRANGARGYWSRKLTEYEQLQQDGPSTAVVMAVDSATGKGRASIVYYQEFDGQDYIRNLMYWYRSCRWIIGRQGKDGKYDYKYRTPLPREICDLIYGEGVTEGQKKLKKQLTKQLLPCITLRRPVPQNLVDAAFHKVINPLSFKDKNGRWDERVWRKAVAITCALVRNLNTEFISFDKGDEDFMEIDAMDQDRSFLYGRLLAVADTIEQIAQKQGETSRTTNAMRYFQRFQQRPSDTWVTLRLKLQPYLDRMPAKQQSWYRGKLSKIESMFLPGEIKYPQPLDVRFLEGYSKQIMTNYKGRKTDSDNADVINKEEE